MSVPICYHCGKAVEELMPVVLDDRTYHVNCWSAIGAQQTTDVSQSTSAEQPMPPLPCPLTPENKYSLRPRNDFVVVREEKVDMVKGLFMPEATAEGKIYVVEAVGTKDCADLKVGDVVRINGKQGEYWAYIPNHPGKIIVRQECVILVMDPVVEETAYEQAVSD